MATIQEMMQAKSKDIQNHQTQAISLKRTQRGIAELIIDEAQTAASRFAPFNSHHEGFAVLKEEVDELWDEVKRKSPDKEKLKREAIQVGAMALRFIHDLCE